jgi:hypothetical protein
MRAAAAAAAAAGVAGGGRGAAQLEEAARAALTAYASRPRIVLMSATFDTSIFADFYSQLSGEFAASLAAGGLGAESPLMALPLLRLAPSLARCEPAGPPAGLTALPRPPAAALAGSLGRLLLTDEPPTVYVGAKRYPVATVFLEQVYADAALKARGMPLSEKQQVAGAAEAFDRAAAGWAQKQGRMGGASAAAGVADALT